MSPWRTGSRLAQGTTPVPVGGTNKQMELARPGRAGLVEASLQGGGADDRLQEGELEAVWPGGWCS